MNNYYAKTYTEVLTILKALPQEEFSKIPQEEIDFYEKNCDKNYIFKIDENISLEEQKVTKMTNAILISIYMDYFLSEEQRIVVKDILKLNRIKEENKKSKEVTQNSLKSVEKSNNIVIEAKENSLIEKKEIGFFTKIIMFIKKFLKL